MGPEGYDIKEMVAQSLRTTVRRAVRRRDQAPVILKTLLREPPNRRESGQLEFEYRILRKLESPGVIRALGVREGGGAGGHGAGGLRG